MTRWRRRLRFRADERGFTILEVTVAMGLFALVALGLATSTKAGLNLIGSSNGRQTATQLAARWMEESRGLPYDALGMSATEAYETDATSPDSAVDDGTFDAGSGPVPLRHLGGPGQ
jgi:prepilin-type N-terminal cleavage/methylation domain-containing protein